jgi:hypothetical protein
MGVFLGAGKFTGLYRENTLVEKRCRAKATPSASTNSHSDRSLYIVSPRPAMHDGAAASSCGSKRSRSTAPATARRAHRPAREGAADCQALTGRPHRGADNILNGRGGDNRDSSLKAEMTLCSAYPQARRGVLSYCVWTAESLHYGWTLSMQELIVSI